MQATDQQQGLEQHFSDMQLQAVSTPVEALAEVLCLVVQHSGPSNALQDVRTFCCAVCAHPRILSTLSAAAVGRLRYTFSVRHMSIPGEIEWLTQHVQLLREVCVVLQDPSRPVPKDKHGWHNPRVDKAVERISRTLLDAEAAQPGSATISGFTTPWVSTDVLAALPAQHLTRLTVNHLWPQAISQPVLDELLTLTHLQDLTLGFAAGVSSRDAFEAIAKLTRPQDIPKLPQDIDSSVSTASPSFAALTALTCLQVPYLPPDDQQTLPTTLRELRLVDGAFGNAVPLKLSHLTAVSRLVFVGNSSMPGKVFGSIGGPGAYCLVRGSALPPAVQQLEVQAVASMEPILKLQHLQALTIHEASDASGKLWCPLEELLTLTKLTALTKLQPGGQVTSYTPHIVRDPLIEPVVCMPVDLFTGFAPVFASSLPCILDALSIQQKGGAGEVFNRANLSSLASLTTLTRLDLVGHAPGMVRCSLAKFNQLPCGLDPMDPDHNFSAVVGSRWGVVWDVCPPELAEVLRQLKYLSELEMRGLRLAHNRFDFNSDTVFKEGVAVGVTMLPVVEAVASLPCLTSLSFSDVLLGPAAVGIKPAVHLRALQLHECFVDDCCLCGLLLGDFGSRNSLTKLDLSRDMTQYGDLSASPALTDVSLEAIGRGLPVLQWLSLRNHRGVSVEALQQLAEQHEGQLEILHDGYEWMTKRSLDDCVDQPYDGPGYWDEEEDEGEDDWDAYPDDY